MLIDTHAHLDMEQFAPDLPQVLDRAWKAGIIFIVTIGADLQSSKRAASIAGRIGEVYFSPGFHPHDVKDVKDGDYGEFRALALMPKAVAVGETGLDYHYDLSPRPVQREHFARQINLARELGKPLIVHSREADKDTMDILRAEKAAETGGALHCFSGDHEMARQALDLGFHISVGGSLTFKKAEGLRDVIKTVPIERMIIETDAPYLAPHPFRGRRNEPAYIVSVAERLAEIKGLSPDDIGRITSLNAMTLFKIGRLPDEGRIAYPIRDSLYLNITNRCTNECVFCVRNTTDFVKGHNLRLSRDPGIKEVMDAMTGFERYREVVFCGYGEPFLRLELIKEVAAMVKEKGIRVRVNTNGHALLIHGRDVLPEIAGIVDALSVSLNFPTGEEYVEACRPDMGGRAYESIKEFVIAAKRRVPEVVVTVLDMPGVDLNACRKVAEEELGVPIRIREYNVVG